MPRLVFVAALDLKHVQVASLKFQNPVLTAFASAVLAMTGWVYASGWVALKLI
jgi:hypothetical protein